jgi:ATP-binding cassette subfamily B protein
MSAPERPELASIAWPLARAAESVETLARAAKLPLPAIPSTLAAVPVTLDEEQLGPWLDGAAARLALETEPIRATNGDIASIVRGSAPALLYAREPTPCLVATVRVKKDRVLVVTPERGLVWIDPTVIEDALWAPVERSAGARADAILARVAAMSKGAARDAILGARTRNALVREPYSADTIDAGWMLRLPPSAPFRAQAARASLFRTTALMLAATIVGHLLGIVSWWLMGRGALGGTLDKGWMIAWALLLVTTIPVRVAASWWQGLIGVTMSALIKQRMLVGALRLDPEEVRGQGTGQILGRVIESEAVESLALNGGFASVLATIELAMTAPVLALSTGGLIATVTLLGWTVLAMSLVVRYARRMQDWAAARVKMTDDLVERMVGHRTRVAQEPPGEWHDEEDRALSNYAERSAKLDNISALMGGVLSRGWTIVGLLSLIPGFLLRDSSAGGIAAGIGGVLLARGAFGRLAGGMTSIAGAQVAWRQIAPIYRSAARVEAIGAPSAQIVDPREKKKDEPLLVASDVVFRYRPQGEPTLKRVTLRIDARDRVLLEGPSGGGKSTLGSILTGLRAPESGLLLLDGLDRHTLGARGWRRRVVAAPQFHENHVLSNTLAFNLLMGRRWPPHPDDFREAVEVCNELGLGPLLERMPSGLMQMIGETGWQLSHGEKSRLFIARALLQRSRLVVLDESFAALDPETLGRCMRTVLQRAPALVVIAHP